MLKGRVQIQLKNVNTGEIQFVEQDNMITDAIAKMLGIATQELVSEGSYSYLTLFRSIVPIATKGLGGIMLFDGTLTEDAGNIHFPMNVHLTGNAGQVTNTKSKFAGSINEAESHANDNGYTNVWDFSTSQANGTIASLALTGLAGGACPFATDYITAGEYIANYYNVPIAMDVENCNMYIYHNGSLYKKHMYNEILKAASPIISTETLVKDLGLTDPKYDQWVVSNGYDGYLYAAYVPYMYSEGSINVRIKRFKASDFSFDEEAEQTFTVSNVTAIHISGQNAYLTSTRIVAHGYLYFVSSDYTKIYKVNLANTADIKAFTFDEFKVTGIFPRYSGGVYITLNRVEQSTSGSTKTSNYPALLYEDGKWLVEDTKATNSDTVYNTTYEFDNLFRMQYYPSSSKGTAGFSTNYLGTICNLASPVVKTSAQTMKITYTLTDA